MTLENLVGKSLMAEPTTTEVKALTAAGRQLESHLREWLRTHKPELLKTPNS